MKKHLYLLTALLIISCASVRAYDYEDDIYYNPAKSKKQTSEKVQSNYIQNFDMQDVDAYNRRGQYYVSPVDTIGDYVANGEDFVYTQKIQKFYNPTIVVDNADLLSTVLANSYGNVEVIYNPDGPVFSSVYSPWNSWNYSLYPGWGWTVGWDSPYWGPSWSFGFGPAWSVSWGYPYNYAWGPSWGWWGPSWSYGYYPPHHHHHYYRPAYAWTPGRNSVNRPGVQHGTYLGQTGGSRPGVSARPGTSASRPGTSVRPGTSSSHYPGGSSLGGNRGSSQRPVGVSTPAQTRPSTSTRPTTGTRPSTSTGRPGSSVNTTRPGSTWNSGTNSSGHQSSGRGSSSVSRPASSSSSSPSYSRPSNSGSSGRGTSSGRTSGSSRGSSGGRGGRR